MWFVVMKDKIENVIDFLFCFRDFHTQLSLTYLQLQLKPEQYYTIHNNIIMAFSLMSKVVSSKVDGIFKSDEEEKEPPSGKELKVLINQL